MAGCDRMLRALLLFRRSVPLIVDKLATYARGSLDQCEFDGVTFDIYSASAVCE
jgi:hypothetical protein